MRIRFTLGDARQVESRYACYLLGVLVAEVDEGLKSLWRYASAGDRHNMHVHALHTSVASRDIASRYGSAGGHPAPDVSGPAHRVHEIVSRIYEEHRDHRPGGELTEAEINSLRKDMQNAGRLVDKMLRAASEACEG